MERRHQIARRVIRAVLAVTSPVAAAAGCATVAGLSKDMNEFAPFTAQKAPAVDVICGWQHTLTSLPDPLRNGAPTVGIAGQVFLFAEKGKPAEPDGELTVRVTDVSPRPAGQPSPIPEVWHFTSDTLKNLILVDERFGRSLVVFLPWPDTWRDVTRVQFLVRYDQPTGQKTLFAKETLVTLDLSAGKTGGLPGALEGGGAVPNPAEILKQARAAQAAGRKVQPGAMIPPTNGVQPTGYPPAGAWGPPPGNVPMPSGPVNSAGGTYPPGYYGAPNGAGGVQSATVPYLPAGAVLATPGPPEIRTQFP